MVCKLIERFNNATYCNYPFFLSGLTLPLVTNDAGDKFGKSLPNAVWLDRTLTSAFDFYQFFIRTEDNKVEQLLKLFTFLSLEQIAHLMEKQVVREEIFIFILKSS